MKAYIERLISWILCSIFGVCLGIIFVGCDSGDVITEIIECQLPPGHCQMDDDEFEEMFNTFTTDEQTAYVEEWGQPEDQRAGFVSGE